MLESAEHPVEADSCQAHFRLRLVTGRGHQHDRGLGRHDLSGVLGEPAAETDIDRATQVSGGERHVVASIDHDRAGMLVVERLGHRQGRHGGVFGEELSQLAVAVGGEGEVQAGRPTGPA